MTQKRHFKLPKWLRDTIEAVVMIAVLMAIYNFFGPMVFPKGTYFPWWTYPYSVLAALLVVGAWNLAARKFRMISQQLKADEAAKQQRKQQADLRQAKSVQDQQEAVKRRQRNQSKQQSRP